MLEGIRQFQTFKELSEEQKQNNQRIFIFPYEPEYDSYVRKSVATDYEVFSKVYRFDEAESSWKHYHIEAELNRHR